MQLRTNKWNICKHLSGGGLKLCTGQCSMHAGTAGEVIPSDTETQSALCMSQIYFSHLKALEGFADEKDVFTYKKWEKVSTFKSFHYSKIHQYL